MLLPFFVCSDVDQHVAALQAELDKAHAKAQSLKEKVAENAELLRKEQEICGAAQSKVVEVEKDLSKQLMECDALKAAKDADAVENNRLRLGPSRGPISGDLGQGRAITGLGDYVQ